MFCAATDAAVIASCMPCAKLFELYLEAPNYLNNGVCVCREKDVLHPPWGFVNSILVRATGVAPSRHRDGCLSKLRQA